MNTKTSLGILITSLISAASLHAATIFTESFEDPVVIVSASNTIPTGWTEPSGSSGINTNLLTDTQTPFGSQFAWANNPGSLLSNATLDNTVTAADTIGALLAEGTYTLSLNLAQRAQSSSDYRVELLAGGVVIGTATGTLTDLGEVDDFSRTDSIVVVIGSGHAQLGTDLQVRLGSNGTFQAQFDNLQLDFVAIPEPSTALLGGLGLLALLRRRR